MLASPFGAVNAIEFRREIDARIFSEPSQIVSHRRPRSVCGAFARVSPHHLVECLLDVLDLGPLLRIVKVRRSEVVQRRADVGVSELRSRPDAATRESGNPLRALSARRRQTR